MIRDNNDWFYYKKIISWFLYAVLTIVGTVAIYYSIDYIFRETFETRRDPYLSHQVIYTSEPGTDPGPVDKSKWKNQSTDKGWNVPVFYKGVIHPLVALTIAAIIVVAIIGGVVVFRSQSKSPHR